MSLPDREYNRQLHRLVDNSILYASLGGKVRILRMDQRDESDLMKVVGVLRDLREQAPDCSEVPVKEVLARTALPMPRLVSLTRRYGAALAHSIGVGHVRYEPGRYVRYVGPKPARIYFDTTAGRPKQISL